MDLNGGEKALGLRISQIPKTPKRGLAIAFQPLNPQGLIAVECYPCIAWNPAGGAIASSKDEHLLCLLHLSPRLRQDFSGRLGKDEREQQAHRQVRQDGVG